MIIMKVLRKFMSKFVYVLNGKVMKSKKQTHIYLKERFDFPDYYGHNLDALFDMLTGYNDSTKLNIVLIYTDDLIINQPEYGEKLIITLMEASLANDKIQLKISPQKSKSII